ncbi:hypothetical protein [Flavobacterium sp. N502536]|uniref:hypothetical protein n=1 Tax=Flavobacterium sp. N502536 TaxID=2986837 RepID=UPI0022232DC7|nr:hypothetical protein [Flavobacterium sp. N502536]
MNTAKNIEEQLEDLTTRLLEMVNLYCCNDISENLVFILSDISKVKGENFFIQRRNKNKLNKKTKPKNFNEAILDLKEIYDSIYDINLYVYKAEKHQTIIDIRYFLKSNLEPNFVKTIINNPPMLHCKIAHPPYFKNDDKKFDANWELGSLRYSWNMFWWRAAYKYKQLTYSVPRE